MDGTLPKSKILLFFLFFIFVQANVLAETITSTTAGGNWSSSSSWVGGVVPGLNDDVIIETGSTVTVATDIAAKSITVKGILTVNDTKVFTVYGNVYISSSGTFNAGTKTSDTTTIKVYGNFINDGKTFFNKSNVIISGNLATASTDLQNNGIVIVGGNVSGTIGGSGSGTIYPVDPNASVTSTGPADEKPAGTQPSDQTLIDLMDEVVYGGACSIPISINSVIATNSCEVTKVSSVTINSSVTSLPVGTYSVIYSLGYNGNSTSYTASMSVTTAGVGNFVANLSIVNTTSSSTIRVNKIISSSCYTNISANNTSNVSYMTPSKGKPVIQQGYVQCSNKWIAQWNNESVDGYYLDVAKDASFTNYLPGYQNLNVGNVINYTISGLADGGVYYYRVRSYNYCGVSPNSDIIMFTYKGDSSSTPGTILGGSLAVCVGSNTPAFTNSGSNPTNGIWSIFNQTGSATITQAGIVTGVSPGNVLVVYTTFNGTCGSSTSKTLNISGGAVSTASSTPTVCINNSIPTITHTTSGFTAISNSGISGANGLPAGVSATFASNMITITGTPTVSGTFNYTIPLTGGSCGSANVNATGTITVADKPSLSAIAPVPILCVGSSLNPNPPTVTSNGSTVTFSGWELETAGASNSFTNITVPYTVALADNGKNIRYTVTNGCGISVSNIVSITVNPVPSPPVISSSYNLNCANTSFDATWSGSSDASNYRIDVADDNGFSNIVTGYNNLSLGNGLSKSITGLSGASVFYVRLRAENSCGSSTNSNIAKVSLPITATTDGINWDNDVPDFTKRAEFKSGAVITLTTTLNACSCQIDSGAKVTVGTPSGPNNNAILNLVNGLDVQSAFGAVPAGAITFENGSSLVQTNAALNTGVITYKRITTPLKKYDYVYWGSPVTGQALNTTALPNSDLYYSWGGSNWVGASGAMVPGVGYISRVNSDLTSQTASFTGTPNNGVITFNSPLSTAAYCLIGNPYPSAVSADAFIIANFNTSTTSSGGTLYFWTHNTERFQSGNQLVYSSNDYSSYNLTGPTKTVKKTAAISDTSGKVASGQIAAGQAFFVGNNSNGKFTFTNAMRTVDANYNNSQFFRQSTTKKAASIEKNRVWLNLTNEGGAFKQLLVGYVSGATNDYDNLYDGVTYNGNSFVDFYSINNTKSLSIQGRKLPFDPADEVPLGYKTTVAGTFQIGIDDVDGDLVDQPIYLEDKLTNKTHNLKSGDYSFTTEIGTFKDRFVLRYSDTSKLGTGDFETKGKGVVVSVNNRQIKVNSFDETISAIKVYDLNGSVIYEKEKVNNNEFIIDHLKSSDQFMIVMTQLENGKWITEEIIFHD